MRTYTLAFSIVIHSIIVGVLVVLPIVANDVVPTPGRALKFTEIETVPPPTIPAPPRARHKNAPQVADLKAAPLAAADDILPETEREAFETEGQEGGVPGGIPGCVPGSIVSGIPEPPPPPAPESKKPLPVGGAIQPPKKVRSVMPVYPAVARAAGKEGTVILEAVIGEDGRVNLVKVLRSIQLLDQAAIDAVRQWEFTPTLLNGQPVTIVMTVTVTFSLQR
jgi:periplasmic protein TonB